MTQPRSADGYPGFPVPVETVTTPLGIVIITSHEHIVKMIFDEPQSLLTKKQPP